MALFSTMTMTSMNSKQGKINGIDMFTVTKEARGLCKQGRLKEAVDMLQRGIGSGIRVDSDTYSYLLQGCLDNKALAEAKLLHLHITNTGFQIHTFLWNKLLFIYAKHGTLADARTVLDQMPNPNVVSWTVMIAAYARRGDSQKALALFHLMKRRGIEPNQFTYAGILPACATIAYLQHAEELHEEIIRSGFESNLFVGSSLIDVYVKCKNVEKARKVFDKMPERNVVSWTAMLAGYAHNGRVDDALKLFREMPEKNAVSWNAMIAGFTQNGFVEEALKLFQEMPHRNVISWNSMITGYALSGQVDEALKLFQEMPERDVISSNAMIAHEDIIRSGFQSDVFVGMPL
jgi:pentatricopeptide repeat protein